MAAGMKMGSIGYQGFPVIPRGVSPEDVRNGVIRVIATSPSGRSQILKVMDVDGMYNTNFTPDETGDWTVAVLYEGKHIEGSPFHVRVFNPGSVSVMGLDSGLASKNYTFNVSVAGAGEGSLTIDITHDGKVIPAQIQQVPRQKGEYSVKFVPEGSGYYTIRIYFAEVEVTGSPYTVEVIDNRKVTASGPGLSAAQVGQRTFFTVNTSNAGGHVNDCRVTITEPKGTQIQNSIIDQHDGNLRVEFVPQVVGDHRIEILYYGKPAASSPYYCVVSDKSQVTVSNLSEAGQIGKPVEFDINAAQAGPGDLEVMVNGGSVPCTVVSKGNKQFHASFTPRTTQPHDVVIRFNGQDIEGSPFRVFIVTPSQVSVVGAGLREVPANEPTFFEVRGLNGMDSKDLTVNITSPSKRVVSNSVTAAKNGDNRVEYTPTEAGSYSIEVSYDGEAVRGSPFVSKVYDASAIKSTPVKQAFVGEKAEFTVDATSAGEGELEIMINQGTVPNTATLLKKGVLLVSFVPKDTKTDEVEITFHGYPCKGASFSVPVIDLNQVVIQSSSRSVPANRSTTVRVNTQSAGGDSQIEVQVSSPSGSNVVNRVTGNSSRGFDVEFTPTEPGEYKMDVRYAGRVVNGSPYEISSYDVNKIKVYDMHDAILNVENSFRVDTTGAGEGNVDVKVSGPSGAPVVTYVRTLSPGILGVFYTPVQSGAHLVAVTFNGDAVTGSPFRMNVLDPTKASARGEGLDLVQCGQVASFFMCAPSAQLKDFNVKIIGPNSRDLTTRITDVGMNNFKVEYTPTTPGDYRIEITCWSQPIPHSPFTAKAWDINKVSVSNIATGRVGSQSSFSINAKDAGEGNLEISISGPSGQNISNTVTAQGPGIFSVAYVPLEYGMHRANVTFNGESVNGNPFPFAVNDPSRAVARGEGLGSVKCGQPTSINISALGAQLKDVDVKITAPNKRDVLPRLTEAGANNFKATYTPTVAGDYVIEISCFDQPITGSPFTAQASDISKVIVSNIPTGSVGQQSTFAIDVKNAGDCTLEISISGPSGQNVSNNVNAQSPGLFVVSFVPVESGQHRANITFNKENVSGSPFTFVVIDPLKANARGDGLGLVRSNQQTSFLISAPAAQLHDLEVAITGPGNKQLTPRVTENGANGFKVDYTPVAAGDYHIDVLYFNQAIPGSPFTAKVWNPAKVITSAITTGSVGIPSTFTIELKEAGEGTLEISINGPSGQNIPNSVVSLGPAQFEVAYTPVESGQHRANITFNKENVTGSPFQFLVTDLSKATVRGDGLGTVKAGQQASFLLSAPAAQLKDIDVRIMGPGGKEAIPAIGEQGANTFKVDFTPPAAGEYKVDVLYFGQPIANSPFTAKAWDASKVNLTGLPSSNVGLQSAFNIDAKDAGEGTLEVSISGPSGRVVQTSVTQLGPGRYEVVFVPVEVGNHFATVTFNKESVPGSRFQFNVIDVINTSARGEGLGTVRSGNTASFTIMAAGVQLNNLGAQVTGPDGKEVAARLTDSSTYGSFNVEYLPVLAGQYIISVTYYGLSISGSPFTAKAWNASVITTKGPKTSSIAKMVTFNVDASQAGEGNFDAVVTAGSESVPSTFKNLGIGSYELTFTPQRADVHLVMIKFNGEMIPGSPFSVSVIDGSRATASGDGLGSNIIANKLASFFVNTKMVFGDAELEVAVTSPRGQPVTAKTSGSSSTGYNVEYTPLVAGRFVIDVKYASIPITGSPFYPEVIDPYQVRIPTLPAGFIGKPVTFDVDATNAGEAGRLTVDVRGLNTRPLANVSQKTAGVYTVSFVPQESVEHSITITYNNIPVPGSPFNLAAIDISELSAKWDNVRLRPVRTPSVIELDPKQAPEADVTCTITDPQGMNIPSKITKVGRIYKVEFTSQVAGETHIDLRYGGTPVPGSPFTCNQYDTSKIQISDITTSAKVAQPASFTIDATGSGIGGSLDVDVISNDVRIPTQIQTTNVNRKRYVFVPSSPYDHVVSVKYNNQDVPGAPFIIRVINPAGQMSLDFISKEMKQAPVGQLVTAIVATQGIVINPADLNIKVTGPAHELQVFRLTPLQDNNFKIEYTSKVTGLHSIEVQYAGQTIQGSPLETEFFDPSKILIEGTKTGTVGESLVLDAMTTGAGKAELVVSIKDSDNREVQFGKKPSASGYQIQYTPQKSGTYTILMTFGGAPIPGFPIQQQIEDGFLPTASGEGLVSARENQQASFIVNAKGRQGDLSVRVQGPHSLALCNVEQQAGDYSVTYTPVEVGNYSITIVWNNKQIPGSPFKCAVYNPEKLTVVGGWQQFLLVDNKMQLELYKTKRIEFDSSQAGPGELGVQVFGPFGEIQVDVQQLLDANKWVVSFVPDAPGNYAMKVYWCNTLLRRSPIFGTVAEPPLPVEPPPPVQPLPIQPSPVQPLPVPPPAVQPAPIPTPPSNPTCDPRGIVLNGSGLTNARVQEEAEFTIDGSNAGPGEPVVKLVGVKFDIDVHNILVSPKVYKCVYTPQLPGAYLLSVSWGTCQVYGSPFKVTVSSGSDPSKVVVSGAGLSGGSIGQDFSFTVDIRRAGSGELSATCNGPSKPAICQLQDQRDGTFLLRVMPQEAGNHLLRVTFNGEPIPGSPFNFPIQSGADASKVRVSGPGIQSGVLATFQSTFLVETSGAGPGRLTVRVRGPKGAFRVEMKKDPDRDRAIRCRYNPTEVGQYLVHVKWSDVHVPGSPFMVNIVDTLYEIEMIRSRSTMTMGNPYDDGEYGQGVYGGGCGSSFLSASGYGGSSDRVISNGMSTINGDTGLIFGHDN